MTRELILDVIREQQSSESWYFLQQLGFPRLIHPNSVFLGSTGIVRHEINRKILTSNRIVYNGFQYAFKHSQIRERKIKRD